LVRRKCQQVQSGTQKTATSPDWYAENANKSKVVRRKRQQVQIWYAENANNSRVVRRKRQQVQIGTRKTAKDKNLYSEKCEERPEKKRGRTELHILWNALDKTSK